MNNKASTRSKKQTRQRKHRPTIGFFNIDIEPEWALWPWQGIMDAARKHDFNSITFVGRTIRWTSNFDEQANVIYDLANGNRLEGLIIWNAGVTMALNEPEIEALCNRYNIPVVTLEGVVPGRSCVSYDNYRGMKAVVDHLVEVHGFRRIGFVGNHEHHLGFKERHRAYADSMISHGLAIEPQLDLPFLPPAAVVDIKVRERTVNAWLEQAFQVGLEAVVGVTDEIAIMLMHLAQVQGRHVPEDVAVAGFDGFTEGRYSTPPLTSVKPSWYDLGYTAMEKLVQMLEGASTPEELIVPYELSVRQSCGCMDASVVAAAGRGSQSAEAVLSPPAIASEMIQIAQVTEIQGIPFMVERLVADCGSEITQEKALSFLRQFESILRVCIQAESEVSLWQDALSIFQQRILTWLESHPVSPQATGQIQTLCQQARVMIGKTAERVQANQRLQSEQGAASVQAFEQLLITTFDCAILMDVLANGLPGLGIPGCYLSLYEQPHPYQYPNPAPKWSRLMLAYDEKGRVKLDPGGMKFPSRELVPQELWPQDRACSFVVQPFYFRERQLGFALFEVISPQKSIYNTLRADISSSLRWVMILDERKRDEEALARERNLLHTVIDNIPDHIYAKDADCRFTLGNNALARHMGIAKPEEIIGKNDFDFYPPDLAAQFHADELAIIQSGQSLLNHEEHTRDSAGRTKWILTTKVILCDDQGKNVGLVGIGRDITERKQAEETLQKQQQLLLITEKMASLGRLTAGIAHEMNTPLAAVRSALSTMKELIQEYQSAIGDADVTAEDHLEIAQEMEQIVRLAIKAAERASGFVSGIKSQTRALASQDHVLFDAVPVIREALLLLSHVLRERKCEVVFEPGAEAMELHGAPGRLAQVVTNLVNNSVDANSAKNGGPITLRLARRPNEVELQVIDLGCGITPEILPKIYDPMFTTKPFGQSTGLGLTIVHDIITGEFGGSIDVASQVGQGTTFTLHFPAH